MTPAEKKMRAERDRLRLATKMSIVRTIETISRKEKIEIGEHDTHVLVANVLFEMLANVCTTYDLDLNKEIHNTLGESGADIIAEYVVKAKASEKASDAFDQILGKLLGGNQATAIKVDGDSAMGKLLAQLFGGNNPSDEQPKRKPRKKVDNQDNKNDE